MPTEKIKILVVEDNPADARLLEEIFKEHGGGEFKLIWVDCLTDALKELSATEIDAILLDLTLPESAGLETLDQVLKIDPLTPLIVVTGLDDEATAYQALVRGAQDYIVKGEIDGERLLRALRFSVIRSRQKNMGKLELMEKSLSGSADTPAWFKPSEGPKPAPWRDPAPTWKSPPRRDSIDLDDLLENEKVEAHFQPWISLKKKSVVGFEGLCRGVGKDSDNLISPLTLLKLAGQRGRLSALDALFRKKVLEGFEIAAQWNPDLVLSVNFETSLLNDGEDGMEGFVSQVYRHHLDPGHIAIEILESRSHDLNRLKRFVKSQRDLGFLIALDDIGAGYSNLDRIAELEPDLIKADRVLAMGIDQSYHKQEVFKSLVKLAHHLGSLLVAEGVETEGEAMVCLELGADMIQGFYFSKPQKMHQDLLTDCGERIHESSKKFKSYLIQNINAKKSYYREYNHMINQMARDLSQATLESFDAKLEEILHQYPKVDSLFILDATGTQTTGLAHNGSYQARQNVFFRSSERGADHSIKDYFYGLMGTAIKDYTFVTTPYLSLATGKLCITISALFKDRTGNTKVLCMNVKPEPFFS